MNLFLFEYIVFCQISIPRFYIGLLIIFVYHVNDIAGLQIQFHADGDILLGPFQYSGNFF